MLAVVISFIVWLSPMFINLLMMMNLINSLYLKMKRANKVFTISKIEIAIVCLSLLLFVAWSIIPLFNLLVLVLFVLEYDSIERYCKYHFLQ